MALFWGKAPVPPQFVCGRIIPMLDWIHPGTAATARRRTKRAGDMPIPYMRYLGMINLESTDGENIFNQIISFCNDREISSHRIIHFGSDGASTMVGKLF